MLVQLFDGLSNRIFPRIIRDSIPNGAVNAAKIESDSIDVTKIKDGSITANKILNGTITKEKFNNITFSTSDIMELAITTTKIADGNVTTAKIADGNVTTAKIADGSISKIITFIIPKYVSNSNGWTKNTIYEYSNTSIKETSKVILDLDFDDQEYSEDSLEENFFEYQKLYSVHSLNGKVRIYFSEILEKDLPIKILILEK